MIKFLLYSLLFLEDVNLSSFCPSWDLNHSSFSLSRDVNQSSFYPSRDVNLSSLFPSGDLNMSYLNLQNTVNTLQLQIILHEIKHEDKGIFLESLQKSIRTIILNFSLYQEQIQLKCVTLKYGIHIQIPSRAEERHIYIPRQVERRQIYIPRQLERRVIQIP